MSYNESLRSNSNYPPMSQHEWNNAPWNQTDEEDYEENDYLEVYEEDNFLDIYKEYKERELDDYNNS